MCPTAPPEREKSYTVRVLIRVFPDGALGDLEKLLGYVFIVDTSYEVPKTALPGGGVRKAEPLVWAAVREVREETALVIEPSSLQFIREVSKNSEDTHRLCVYVADITWTERKWMNGNQPGNEGERPVFVSRKEIQAGSLDPPFLEPHGDLLKACGIDLIASGG